MSTPTMYDKLHRLTRGDMMLVRRHASQKMEVVAVHSTDVNSYTQTVKVRGTWLSKWLDLSHPFAESNDFNNQRFLVERNPAIAVASLRSEVVTPTLEAIDQALFAFQTASSGSFLQLMPHGNDAFLLDLDERDEYYVNPTPGAIRQRLLGFCPFRCRDGYILAFDVNIFFSNWPDFLLGLCEGGLEALEQYEGIFFCPGCMGLGICRRLVRLWKEVQFTWDNDEECDVDDLPPEWKDWFARKDERRAQLGYTYEPQLGIMPYPTVSQPISEERKRERHALVAKLSIAPHKLWIASQERVGKDMCAVCRYVPYEDDDEIIGLPCQHFFHRNCLTPWLERFDDCPTCRKKLEVFKKEELGGIEVGLPVIN